MATVTLYHGTCDASAEALLASGWKPNGQSGGSHCGDPRLLYLTTGAENALWYAQEKGSSRVLCVTVELSDLMVDPEDGIADTVEEELVEKHGMPGNLALVAALPASAFAEHVPAPRP